MFKRLLAGLCLALALSVCANARGSVNDDLLKAAELGGIEDVSRLLADGADVNATNVYGNTPLQAAASLGHKSIAELLIAKGADVNAKDSDGDTPLHDAVTGGRKDIAELLIAKGGNVNTRNKRGVAPLHIAAKLGVEPIASLLIRNGTGVDAKDNDGATPLLEAFGSLFFAHIITSESLIAQIGRKSLLLSGSRLEQEREKLRKYLRQGMAQYKEVAMLLIGRGADVNATLRGDTPLGIAALIGDKNLVAALVDKGANIDGPSGAKETPLHAAIGEGYRDVAELLIRKGANVNSRNFNQHTPLHFLATFMDDIGLAELMLAKGAEVNATDARGQTAMRIAITRKHSAIAEFLRQHGGR